MDLTNISTEELLKKREGLLKNNSTEQLIQRRDKLKKRTQPQGILDPQTQKLASARKEQTIGFLKAIPDFLKRTATGIEQLKTFAGSEDPRIRAIAKKARPDLAEEIDALTNAEVAQALGQEFKKGREERVEKLSPEAKKGFGVGKFIAPIATFGQLGTASALGAGGEAFAERITEPTDETLGQKTAQATISGIISAGTYGLVKGGFKGLEKGAGLVKKGVQKLVGVSAEKIDDFVKAGIKPTLADVSNNVPTKGFQNLLEKVPFAGKKIVQSVQKQADDIGKQLKNITEGTGGTQQEAGEILQQGGKRFIDAFRRKSNKLYGKLDNFVKDDDIINFKNVDNFLNSSFTKDFVSVEKTSKGANLAKRVQEVFIEHDGKIPFKRFKELRTLVGKELSSYSMEPTERAIISQLYGSMTEDLRGNLAKQGGEALRTFDVANKFFAKRSNFVSQRLGTIKKSLRQGSTITPENLFSLSTNQLKKGGNKIKKIIQILNPEEKGFFRGTFIKKLGETTPAQQEATGKLFSPNRFLANWNKLAPEGKDAIFNSVQRNSIDNLNKVILNIQEKTRVGKLGKINPYIKWTGLLGLTTASPVGTGLGIGGAKITADMMANPRFINWLSQSSKITSPKILTRHLDKLGLIASKNPAIREDIANYLESITIKEQ